MTSRPSRLRRRPHGRRHAVRGEHHRGAFGNLVELLDEDRAATLEIGDDVLVVDDLLADVDGCAALLERELDGLDRALDARAERARACEQHPARPDGAGPFVERRRCAPQVAERADSRDDGARVEEAAIRAVDDDAKDGERTAVGGRPRATQIPCRPRARRHSGACGGRAGL